MRKGILWVLLGLVAISLAACAKQGYPNGGPRDTQPPTAGRCKPANASYNFDKNQFFIEFDEYVVLKDPDNNVLVSPPMKHKPEYSTKGKGVLVKIKDTLQPNTTYLFQFKNAIADFTEGNLVSSFDYVFSTGTRMDTLRLGGRVQDALTGKAPTEVVTVLAYADGQADADSVAPTPSFVTRCDKMGQFQFHYIPEGQYRLVALVDADRNLRVGEAEAVAWDEKVYASGSTIDTASLPTFLLSSPTPSKQMVVGSAFTSHARFYIATRLPMSNPKVEGAEGEMRLNAKGDTLNFWLSDPKCDSARIVFSDQGTSDTLRLRYRAPSGRKSRRSSNQKSETPLMRSLCTGTSAYYDRLLLAFENPIVRTADSLVATVTDLRDSTSRTYPIHLDSTGLSAQIVGSLQSGVDYSISVAQGLFYDLYGHANDSLRFNLQPKDYATLSVEVANRCGMPLVVQLLDKRDTVVATQPVGIEGRHVSFTHIGTGEYRLRAVLDANADGRWTPGSYALRRQPEQVRYYSKTLNLREKWEMKERWQIDLEP